MSVPLITAVAGVVLVVAARQTAPARELAASRQAIAAVTAREERLRLARELHDSVKQQTFVAALELASARAQLGADPHLDVAADAVHAAQRQLGEVIEHLRPATHDATLVPALRRHVEEWTTRTGVSAELVVEGERDMPAQPLLAVAGEALTNVARHSRARRVRLVLRVTDGRAQLVVDDDGHGFDPADTAPGQGLRGMAERLADLDVVAEAATGAEAVELARQHRPDVALIDLQMPGGGGVDALAQIATEVPGSRLVVLTSHATDADIFPAIRAGAMSYLLKDVAPQELADAVRAAAAGEAVLHRRVAARVVSEMRGGRRDQPDAVRDLTERELEVLRLLAQGLSNADIARRLVIGDRTVKTHVSNILTKLRLADRTQAAVHAWRHGLIRRETED